MTHRDDALPLVDLFSDGACRGNPGPGGWAYILRHTSTGKEKECSGGVRETTNNRMELQAAIEGLKALKRRCRVRLYTDSQYLGLGLSQWLPKWKANGWRRKERGSFKPVKNDDLWKLLDQLLTEHEIEFHHVRGHSGHPENERCDELAVAAYRDL